MENSKRESVPMQEKLRPSKSQGATTPDKLKRMQNLPYASVVGSIMYAMTTSSANNSVFRGFFEKQKLNGSNFIDWYRQLRIVLSIEDKLNYLEQPIPPAPIPVENYNMHNIGKTINELHAILKLHEQTLPKNNAPALHAIQAGHWKRNCPKSWIYDTGCGTHICNTTHGLRASRKLKLGALSLYVGNGQREAVEAIDHCRLRHISKKRIKKLQHDGLLNSTDLRAFKKCVPCMSRKIARKPYTHQVERAKDLLGLIHTDVYGPFKIMSRQGASYFVTFTDDFSHYGYVYLLKHKHEVFETFKVFQKEVENKLGCEALVKRDTLTKPDKLEPRSIKCIFIGYPKETIGYSFYYPPKNKVLVARNAKFLENSLITQEASRSLEDLEIIQEEDTYPSIDTSLHHEEDDLEIDEPQSDIVPIRRSTRIRHAPDRMFLYIDAEEHELGDLGEPANYKATLLDPESDKWLNAMNVEIKWLFKKKTYMDGAVHTYKARIVAKDYTQTPGIIYEETFSPVADIKAIRILIAIIVFYDYEIWQMDVKTAFLNVYLSKEVYMEQPEGFVNPKYPNRVCKLKRSIYGLNQASRQWNK
ncbi:retrotransposon protein, putative, ty1-copia subclass [Tanacetum coccineum]|uniref:Retrotransposon protein, putative, ty1-copia subclass n=1 Tax=Tanacetum coccineum TaxID=301880 RepID=A0ABQ5IZ62_9ASTR